MGYINEGNGPRLAAANISCLAISWLFSPVRVYVKLHIAKSWTIEDWCFVGGQMFFTALALTSYMSAVHGNGQKIKDITSLQDLVDAMRLWFICELLQIITTCLMRLCLGCLLIRVCNAKRYLYTIYATMGVMALNSVVTFILTIFQCHPIAFFWLQFSDYPGKCLPATLVQNASIISSSIMALVDVIFGVVPIFLIWNLQINRKAKIIAGFLLAIGIVAGATVIIRIKFIRDVSLTEDFLFAIADVVIWSMIEPCVGICCLSIVTFRPLFKSLQDKVSSRGGMYGRSKYGPASAMHSATAFSKGPRASRKSWQKMTTENDSNGDSLPLDSLNNVHIRANGDQEDEANLAQRHNKGIRVAQTVEVTKEQRVKDIV